MACGLLVQIVAEEELRFPRFLRRDFRPLLIESLPYLLLDAFLGLGHGLLAFVTQGLTFGDIRIFLRETPFVLPPRGVDQRSHQ